MAINVNPDGVTVKFSRDRGRRGNAAGVVRSDGKITLLVLPLDLTGAARTLYTTDRNNDGTLDGFTLGEDTVIPANAKILSVDVVQVVAPAGGTNYSVGTYLLNGTADNAAGLLTTAGAAGAQVGTQIAADRYVTATTTGTYTAGKLQVYIRYAVA